MKHTIRIQKIGLDKLDNALHARFHGEACDLVREVDATTTNVPAELADEWHTLAEDEVDLATEPRTTVYTGEMREKDAERTRAATFIFGIVRTMRLSPDLAQAESARLLRIVTSEYVRLQNLSVERRSADLLSLIYDLRKPELAPHLERLGLTAAVAALERLDGEYLTLSRQRRDERVERKKQPTMIEVRRQSDEIYQRVVMVLQMAYLTAPSDAVRTEIQTLADRLSALTARINTSYKQSLSQRRAKAAQKAAEAKDAKEVSLPTN